MTSDADATALRAWLDGLDEGSIRALLDEATLRVSGLDDWLQTRRALASDEPGDLLAIVNRDLTPSRRFYDYWQANNYAAEAYDTVSLLRTQATRATAGLIPVIERAITLTTRAILKSDDSSGLQGDLVRTLLNAHAEAVRTTSPALAQPEQTRLVKWIIKYRYGGTQDFFDPDIVAYASGLSDKSIAVYRAEILKTDLGEYGGYPLTRLAVLDRDRDAIIAAHGGDPSNPMLAKAIVGDLDEAGLREDAVAYARIGVGLDARGWDDTLVTYLVDDALSRGAHDEAVTLRRDWFRRFPLSTGFARLRETAKAVGAWDAERADAEALLAERTPHSYVIYLLDEDRADEAWDFAQSRFALDEASDIWLKLCERRVVSAPADTLPVYRATVQQTLLVTDKRNYRDAAEQLKKMRDAARAADPEHEASFHDFLAEVVDQNRRRPTCIEAFRKAKLVPRG